MSKTSEINAIQVRETEKAILCEIYTGYGDRQIWFPKSQIISFIGDILEIPTWLKLAKEDEKDFAFMPCFVVV